jgi:CheY-like chemotaxis protein
MAAYPSRLKQANSTVLVVDDDAALSEAIRMAIEDQDYAPICAANGKEALAILESEQPSLMLIDLMMPVMNGTELLAAIRKSERLAKIPRVIMTGVNDPMIRVKEDVMVLYKPVDLNALSELLRRYCRAPPRRAVNFPIHPSS